MASETTGSCLCGACTYSYTGEPAMKVKLDPDSRLQPPKVANPHKALCYCGPCRRVSGGTNTVNFAVPSGNFTVTKGQTKSYPAEHEYGMTLTIFFCPDCGNTLWKEATAEQFKGVKLVQAGTLNDAKNLDTTIDAELYAPERASFLTAIENAAQKKDF